MLENPPWLRGILSSGPVVTPGRDPWPCHLSVTYWVGQAVGWAALHPRQRRRCIGPSWTLRTRVLVVLAQPSGELRLRASRSRDCAESSTDSYLFDTLDSVADADTVPGAASNGGPSFVVLGAFSGVVVVLGFTVIHDVFISDIWFNVGPMVLAGALCGASIAWSYHRGVAQHSPAGWFRYAILLSAEMIALGAVSLLVLSPRFTMAELMVADDAFDRLLPPSIPLMIGAMVVGTAVVWMSFGRRRGALLPILVTQVLLVFLLGHQFAFLGLVESSSTLFVVFGEFALLTIGLTVVFAAGVAWSSTALDRIGRRPSPES